MASDYMNAENRLPKFHESWLDHKNEQEKKWVRHWCVLRTNTLLIFSSDRTSRQSLVGQLTLGSDSRVVKRDGNEKTGYDFDLVTTMRVNRFRAAKYGDRELWYACVGAIATGRVPDRVDLLPGQIADIHHMIQQYVGQRRSVPSHSHTLPNKRRASEPTIPKATESFDFDRGNTSASGSFASPKVDNDNYLVPAGNRTGLSPPAGPKAHILNTSRNNVGLPGGAYINFKGQSQNEGRLKRIFYSDPSRTDIPSWFFPNCTRELASKILTQGAEFGNTLMRGSSSQSNTLVISKRCEKRGQMEFCNFRVLCLAEGYKIDVENPHEPAKTLSDLMDQFVAISGPLTTQPMTCNDLKKLGIEEDPGNDYNTKILKMHQDADSGEELDSFPAEDGRAPLGGIWKERSQSLPAINAEHLAALQARQRGLVFESPSSCYVNAPLRSPGALSGKILDCSPPTQTPPLPQNLPPPLPPNHPSEKKATGQSNIPVAPPPPPMPPQAPPPPPLMLKTSQSTNSVQSSTSSNGPASASPAGKVSYQRQRSVADQRPVTMAPPRSHSDGNFSELEMVTARIKKDGAKAGPEVAPKPIGGGSRPVSTTGENITSPIAATQSFKKKLDNLLAGVTPTSPPQGGAQAHLNPCGPSKQEQGAYESIEHYQNANEVKKILS